MAESEKKICPYWTDTLQNGYTAVRWFCIRAEGHLGYHEMSQTKPTQLRNDGSDSAGAGMPAGMPAVENKRCGRRLHYAETGSVVRLFRRCLQIPPKC